MLLIIPLNLLFFVSFFMCLVICLFLFFFFKQQTAYDRRISDWSSDVCSSDLSQSGRYTVDCRFTKSELERRIRRVRKYRDHIHLHRKDALDFLRHAERNLPDQTFLCVDPPYFNKGATIYPSFYEPEDHAAVAKHILSLDRPWIRSEASMVVKECVSACR